MARFRRKLELAIAAVVVVLLSFATSAGTASAATSFTMTPGSDAREDVPLSITVEAQVDAQRFLWLFWRSSSSGCPTYVQAAESNPAFNAILENVPLNPGSTYLATPTFTPPDVGDYYLCGYVAQSATDLQPIMRIARVFADQATSSLSVSVSPNPVQDLPVQLTLDAQSEVPRKVWLFWGKGSVGCSQTPAQQAERDGMNILIDGQSTAPGVPFSRTVTFTPPDLGTYGGCAFIAEAVNSQQNQFRTFSFFADEPSGSVEADVGADPAEDTQVPIDFSATSEASRKAWFFVTQGEVGCAATAAVQASQGRTSMLVNGASVSRGNPVSRRVIFEPPEAGRYQACGYLAESSTQNFSELRAFPFTVRSARATLNIRDFSPRESEPATLTVTGSSEADRKVFLFLADDDGCLGSAASQALVSPTLINGQDVQAGSFELSVGFTGVTAGWIYLCGFVSESPIARPNQWINARFLVRSGVAYIPVLISPKDDQLAYESAPPLKWQRGPGKDTVTLFRVNPDTSKIQRIASSRIGGFQNRMLRHEVRGSKLVAFYMKTLDYGNYVWAVDRFDKRTEGTERTSETFRVGPRPLKNLRLIKSIRRFASIRVPGSTKVSILSTSLAWVNLKLWHKGRVIDRVNFREGRFQSSRLAYKWSCRRTGAFRLIGTAKDFYGNRDKASVTWRVSHTRCQRMKERARKRQERAEGQSGSGGGGSVGDVDCSDFDTQSEAQEWFEDHGGPSSDPAGLDADNDGRACDALP